MSTNLISTNFLELMRREGGQIKSHQLAVVRSEAERRDSRASTRRPTRAGELGGDGRDVMALEACASQLVRGGQAFAFPTRAPHLARYRALRPELAGGIEELARLATHVAEAPRRPEQDPSCTGSLMVHVAGLGRLALGVTVGATDNSSPDESRAAQRRATLILSFIYWG